MVGTIDFLSGKFIYTLLKSIVKKEGKKLLHLSSSAFYGVFLSLSIFLENRKSFSLETVCFRNHSIMTFS